MARTTTVLAVVVMVALGSVGTWRLVSAIGADVNNDGYVSVGDIGLTVAAFGQTVPTPTPVPPIVGDRVWVEIPGAPEPQSVALVDTSNGSLIATFGNINQIFSSCDGAYASLVSRISEVEQVQLFVDQQTGAVVAESPAMPYGGGVQATALFPCPLKGMGGEFLIGQPAAKRAVTWLFNYPPINAYTIWDLETGQAIFAGDVDPLVGANGRFNCANDAFMYTDAVTHALRLVRLQDGAVTDVPQASRVASVNQSDPPC